MQKLNFIETMKAFKFKKVDKYSKELLYDYKGINIKYEDNDCVITNIPEELTDYILETYKENDVSTKNFKIEFKDNENKVFGKIILKDFNDLILFAYVMKFYYKEMDYDTFNLAQANVAKGIITKVEPEISPFNYIYVDSLYNETYNRNSQNDITLREILIEYDSVVNPFYSNDDIAQPIDYINNLVIYGEKERKKHLTSITIANTEDTKYAMYAKNDYYVLFRGFFNGNGTNMVISHLISTGEDKEHDTGETIFIYQHFDNFRNTNKPHTLDFSYNVSNNICKILLNGEERIHELNSVDFEFVTTNLVGMTKILKKLTVDNMKKSSIVKKKKLENNSDDNENK